MDVSGNEADGRRKFNQLWKDLNTENRSVNAQPPRSQQYLLRLYPHTIERDALLEASEIEFQYKSVAQLGPGPEAETG